MNVYNTANKSLFGVLTLLKLLYARTPCTHQCAYMYMHPHAAQWWVELQQFDITSSVTLSKAGLTVVLSISIVDVLSPAAELAKAS